MALIVHGGASSVPAEEADAYKAGCLAAARAGWAVLEKRGSALDAVEAAVRVLEADETFNAARGGMLNADGEVRECASIMDGSTLRFGAIGAALGLRHPISVARKVLHTGPLLLVDTGAIRFAHEHGAEMCDGSELITPKQRNAWEKEQHELCQGGQVKVRGCDTVGCVALDMEGNLVAGASTGGESNTPPGRMSSSSSVGAGFYADTSLGACAVSGSGEAIMQVLVAKSVIESLQGGIHPNDAAEQVVAMLQERVGGKGGCIVVDKNGRLGWAHTSSEMPCAMMTSEMDSPQVWLRKPTGDGLPVGE